MNNKNVSISLIRVISMLMINSCHILQGLNNKWAFWVNVGVQIFFFVSGFLYGKKEINDTKKFYIGRIKKILIPYIIVLFVVLLLEIFLLHKNYPFSFIMGNFLGFGGFNGNISLLSHTWFISYILICYIFVPVFQEIFKSKSFKTNVANLIILMIFVHFLQKFSVIRINACWINNFILGYFYSKCCDSKIQQRNYHATITTLFIIIIPFAIVYQEGIKTFLPLLSDYYTKIIIDYGHVLLGTMLFIVMYKCFELLKIKGNIIINFLDKYSYYIYLVHQIFILNNFSMLYLTKSIIINVLIIIVLSVILGIVLKLIYDILVKAFSKMFQFARRRILVKI